MQFVADSEREAALAGTRWFRFLSSENNSFLSTFSCVNKMKSAHGLCLFTGHIKKGKLLPAIGHTVVNR